MHVKYLNGFIYGKWPQTNRHTHVSAMQSRWCGAHSGSPQSHVLQVYIEEFTFIHSLGFICFANDWLLHIHSLLYS